MQNFKNKRLLITGGTGSFGNTVLKYFLNTDIKEIVIFSRDEKKQDEMRRMYKSEKIRFVIGDIRSVKSIDQACSGIDYIFHAAALKQVPSCEFYPIEAVKTNILGTKNLIDAAINNNVEKVICLSTDKAAYPINSMGVSKAMMEKVAIAEARRLGEKSKTKICVTRYGNVMGSRGSVIPLFIEQIKNKQPLTITDPRMTRFLMSLYEAVDLVLYAFKHGDQGDLYVQKSPACTVQVLAQSLIEIFNSANDIKIIGPRHGEKLYETLLTKEEFEKSLDLGNYFKVPCDLRDLNYTIGTFEGKSINLTKEYNSDNTQQLSKEEVISKLLELDYIEELAGLKRN